MPRKTLRFGNSGPAVQPNPPTPGDILVVGVDGTPGYATPTPSTPSLNVIGTVDIGANADVITTGVEFLSTSFKVYDLADVPSVAGVFLYVTGFARMVQENADPVANPIDGSLILQYSLDGGGSFVDGRTTSLSVGAAYGIIHVPVSAIIDPSTATGDIFLRARINITSPPTDASFASFVFMQCQPCLPGPS